MILRRAQVAGALLGLLLAAAVSGPEVASAATPPVVSLPVTFQVRNTNTSRLACASDGARYTVKGSLVAPSSALAVTAPRMVTLYLHGFDFAGASTFHFRQLPAYDYASQMAKLGQTSLVIERLGYPKSGMPQGMQTCMGAAADVAHQIIRAIRLGKYKLGRSKPLRFSRVVLAGHDTGAEAAQIEAYSYHDIDGLIVMDFADTGFTPTLGQFIASGMDQCSKGGKPARPGGPGGYFDSGPASKDQLAPLIFPNTDPKLINKIFKYRRRNPCGDLQSIPPALSIDMKRLRTVKVPVLITAGNRDVTFTSDGVRHQRSFYKGNEHVSVAILSNTGHFPMLGRTAPRFRATIAHWLSKQFG